MGEVISMEAYLERRNGPTPEDIRKRLAQISIEQILLSSEKIRLKSQLEGESHE